MPRRTYTKSKTRSTRSYSKPRSRSYSARSKSAGRKRTVSKRSSGGRAQTVRIELIQSPAPAAVAPENPLMEMIAQTLGATTAPTTSKDKGKRKF